MCSWNFEGVNSTLHFQYIVAERQKANIKEIQRKQSALESVANVRPSWFCFILAILQWHHANVKKKALYYKTCQILQGQCIVWWMSPLYGMYDEFANLSTNALNVRVCENGRERFSGLGLFGVFFPTCLFWVCFCFLLWFFFFWVRYLSFLLC